MPHARKWSAVLTAATVGVVVAGGIVAVPTANATPVVPAPPAAGKGLDAHDRALLADARTAGRRTVTLLVAAEPGRAKEAAAQITALGGTVTKISADIGYVKATVPVAAADTAAAQSAVQTADVDGLIPLDDPKPDAAITPLPQTPPDATTPRVNPYLPTGDTHAAQYATSRTGNDGRGTTIAIIDTGVDLASPALATTTTGERKIVDWYDAMSPSDDDGGFVPVTGSYAGGPFDASGRTWTAPAGGGPYSFGVFSETAEDLGKGGEIGGDVNRDGDRNDTWGVLEDPATHEVWVDLDSDADFTDEPAMTDYATRFDVGYFGTDDPATPVAERMPFVVQTDHAGYVVIGIVGGQHGTHVAGITAANGLFGGKMSGAAPGAKIMSIRVCLNVGGCTNGGLIDGVLYAAQHGADLANISIGGLPALNDGNTARAELYNRTIAEYDMQLYISAGNDGAGVNSVGDPAVATDALAIGASVSRETWLATTAPRSRPRWGCSGSRRAVRGRTAGSSPTSSRPDPRSRPSRRGRRADRSPAPSRCRRATRC